MPPRTSRGHDAADRRATAIALSGLTAKAYNALRRALRKILRARGRIGDVKATFTRHGITSQAARARILDSLPRLERIRFYCRTWGLPEPKKWKGPKECQIG